MANYTTDSMYVVRVDADDSATTPDWIANKGWIAFASVVVVLAVSFSVPVYATVRRTNTIHLQWVIGGVSSVLGLWFLIAYWLMMWPATEKMHNWAVVGAQVVAEEANEYRCCEQQSCVCRSALGIPDCSDMLSWLEAGTCDDGYVCCDTRKRRSGTGDGRTCTSYCCDSENNQECTIVCGSCALPELFFTYSADFDGDGVYAYYNTSMVTACTDMDTSDGCVVEFFGQGPGVGEFVKMIADPLETSSIEFDREYTDADWGATLTPGIGMFVCLCAQIGLSVQHDGR